MKNTKPTIFVTGSGGFLGSAIIKRLIPHYDIFAVDKSTSEEPVLSGVEYHEADLASDESVEKNIALLKKRAKIASVIHLAAYYDFSGEPSDLYEKVTVQGTGRLLRALKGLPVEQFIFSSTQLVHAPCEPGQKINESWPLDPKWDYPKSKVDTEQLLMAEHGEIPIVILRMAGVYNDECHSIPISHQIQRIYEKRLTSHVFPGDVFHGQPFVHLKDLVEAVWKTVSAREKLEKRQVILIGEPETYSYDSLQKELGRLTHGEPDWQTTQIPKIVAKTGAWVQDKIPGIEDPFIKPWMIDLADDHCELNISLARRILGWNPTRRLITTLPKMIESLKSDPIQWYKKHHLTPSEAGVKHAAH